MCPQSVSETISKIWPIFGKDMDGSSVACYFVAHHIAAVVPPHQGSKKTGFVKKTQPSGVFWTSRKK